MAISNSMAAAAAAVDTTAPAAALQPHSDAAMTKVAQHIFGEFHVHYDPATSDIHIIHATAVAHPEVAARVTHLAQTCLTPEQMREKEHLVAGGQAKIPEVTSKIAELDQKIQKLTSTIAGLDDEIRKCDSEIAGKTPKGVLSKLKSKNEADVSQLAEKRNGLLERKEQYSTMLSELSEKKSTLVLQQRALGAGSEKAQTAIATSRQITNFRENLQTKLAVAEERYRELGGVEHDGKVIMNTPQGRYDLGLSPAAFKMMIAVSIVTEEVAKDRIIQVHTQGGATLDTHNFYQITAKNGDSASLVHKHGGPLATGGKGVIFKALELVSKEVRILKEMRNVDDSEIQEEVEVEYEMSCAVNPDNMRPGLAHKPHACFDLRREGFGGIGLVFDLYNKGDLSHHLSSLTIENQAEGLLALFSANQSLSANNLLHLDIKPENVFLHGDADSSNMVVADFDGVWNLQLPANEFVARLEELVVPDNSPNSCTRDQIDRLDELGREIRGVNKELKSAELDNTAVVKLEEKLQNYISSYNVTAQCVQNWGVAYTALQTISQQFSLSFKDQEKLIEVVKEKISHCPNQVEKRFLENILGELESILQAPLPEIDQGTGKIKSKVITADQALKGVQAHVDAFKRGEAPSAAAAAAVGSSSDRPEGAALRGQRLSRRLSPPPSDSRGRPKGDDVIQH